ncbi:Transposase [Candidatus Electronema halotolerans]
MTAPFHCENFEISEEDLAATPPAVRKLLSFLIAEVTRLRKRVEELEAKLGEDSSNSNRPPSSDSPFTEKRQRDQAGKPRKKRRGYRQELMPPTETQKMYPSACSCGCGKFKNIRSYYTHQHIELPEIVMQVRHFLLYKGECAACGKTVRGCVPDEFRTGFGARFTALVAELSGMDGSSRGTVRKFIRSVLGVHISAGAVQKIIDRASAAVAPHYEAIWAAVTSGDVGHIDETTWKTGGRLRWLWVMANRQAAFFMIHPKRSKEAFEELIGAWNGILISDGYNVYQKWVGKRQTCLAHLIRRADGLAERADPELAACGKWAAAELRRLCRMAKDPPTKGEWSAFYARLCRLILRWRDCDSDAGRFVRHIDKEMEALFTFLLEEGVEPTNNPAERMLRFGVLWRKRSQGTDSDKGNRWVERILSLRQTCLLRGKSTFEVLTEAMRCYFRGQMPDLSWV